MKLFEKVVSYEKGKGFVVSPHIFWKVLLVVVFAFLSCVNFKGIVYFYNLSEMNGLFSDQETLNFGFRHLLIIYPLVGEYVFISLTVIFFVSLFKTLKSYNEKGLIWGLIWGLIAGLIWGLIAELIAGLIIGLIAGLIWGLIWGLIGEFKTPE